MHGYVANPNRISHNYLYNDLDGSRHLSEIKCMPYNDTSMGSGLITNGYNCSGRRDVIGLVNTIIHVIRITGSLTLGATFYSLVWSVMKLL